MKKSALLAVALLIAAGIVSAVFAELINGAGQLEPHIVFKGDTVYQINAASQSVDVYENDNVILSIDLTPNSPTALAITPDGNKIYVACSENIIQIIDATRNTIAGVVMDPGIRNPVNLLMSDDGAQLSVVNQDGSTVTIDTATDAVIR